MSRKSKTEKAAILASIDPNAETATSALIVDHSSQISSWRAPVGPSDALIESHASADEIAEALAEPNPFVDVPLAPLEPVVEPEMQSAVTDNSAEDAPASPQIDEAPLEAVSEHPVLEDAPATILELPAKVESLAEVCASIDPNVVDDMVVEISLALTRRDDFEYAKNCDNGSIVATLKKVRSQMVSRRAAALLLASNVDESFINREMHTGSRYNVYALGKLADLVVGTTNDGVVSNAINNACMRSLFACKRAGIPFTMEVAKACAGRGYKIDAAIARHLTRHTVSNSTVSTQASSTMQAAVTLGIVTASGGKNPTYTVRDTPIARELEKRLLAA